MKRVALIFILLALMFTLNVAADENVTKNLKTNLTGLTVVNGNWTSVENGVYGNNDGLGNCFIMSDVKMEGGKAFRLSADIAISNVAGGIVFGVENPASPEDIWYCMNIDAGNPDAPLIRLFKVDHGQLIWTNNVIFNEYEKGKTYKFTVEVLEDETIDFYLDDVYIQSQSDTGYTGGYLGIVTCVSPVTFNNIYYEEIVATPTPEPTPTPEMTATPDATATKEPANATATPKTGEKIEKDSSVIWIIASGVFAVAIVAIIILIIKRKK